MSFRVVMKLKDINKERIKISRHAQKKISVNQEIKEALEKESGEGETQAETISRVIKTNHQMTELLITMVESVEAVPNKMGDLLKVIPLNLKDLFKVVINEKERRKKEKNKE